MPFHTHFSHVYDARRTSDVEGTWIMRLAVVAFLFGVSIGFAEEARPAPQEKKIVRQLEIPPRLQWKDRAGYCGECSIQQSALYYGSYISQYVCRKIIDPTQEQDVLVRVNSDLVLEALQFKFEEFDTETPTPHYKPYLEWTKQHLHQGHPVIITMFDQDDDFWDYDHIVLATGFHAADPKKYHPNDTLIFNDNFKLKADRREFKTLHDTREMKGNGAEHYFCIPSVHCFGCAITGIKDETGSLLPVRVSVDQEHEPDVVKKEEPDDLTLTITVSSLQPGKSYVLYRYDNYKKVPTRDYAKSKYHSVRKFVADRAIHEFEDECPSNGVSMYRCLPDDMR